MPAEPDLLASPSDMEARTQGLITAATHPFLPQELAAATDDVRDFCRWHVSPVRQVAYRRVGASPDDVWLPAMMIVSLDEVTIDGDTYTPEQVEAVEFDPMTGWTNLCGRAVTVTFTAGYPQPPANIVTVVLELAAAGLGTSLGYSREQAGTVAVTHGRVGGGLDEATERRLEAWRIGRLP